MKRPVPGNNLPSRGADPGLRTSALSARRPHATFEAVDEAQEWVALPDPPPVALVGRLRAGIFELLEGPANRHV